MTSQLDVQSQLQLQLIKNDKQTAINNCLLFLIKLEWPKNRSIYDETTDDFEYALLVFSTNPHDPIDLNCSIRNNSFETEMTRDCSLLVELNLFSLYVPFC